MGRVMRRPLGRALPLMAALGLLLGLAPGASAVDLGSFGTPTATSSFTGGVTFSQPVTIDSPLSRVELLLTAADAIGPLIIVLPAPTSTGATTLTHHLDTSGDTHIYPNTPLRARWRLVAAGDSTIVQVGPEARVTFADDRFAWQTAAGDLVRVHWYEGSQAFGNRALKIGEDAVRETSELLGVTESEPIDFYVYADQSSFYDVLGPGSRENVGGEAHADIRTLFALIPPRQIDDAWVGQVIPHELTHLVFDTAVKNPYHFPAHWLNEGVAVYQSQGYGVSDRSLVTDAAARGTLIPLDGLIGQFPTTSERFFLAYAESVSAIDYLVRAHGSDALVELIRSYADGRTDDEAFEAALGQDMTAFGVAWLADVHAKPPTRYGPRPAASGPVPAAWTAEAAPTKPSAGPTAAADGGTAGPAASNLSPASPAGTSQAGDSGVAPSLLVIVAAVATGVVVAIAIARHRRRAVGGPS